MQVEKDKVTSIHYTLKGKNGETLDTSNGRDPLAYLHGNGNIIRGLESALEGKSKGDKLEVTIEPKDAYGERNDELQQKVSKDNFEEGVEIKPGMQFQAQTPEGAVQIFHVLEVDDSTVTLDGNHPLAGETLYFDVEVIDIRDASNEELEHGHVHGPGGHNH